MSTPPDPAAAPAKDAKQDLPKETPGSAASPEATPAVPPAKAARRKGSNKPVSPAVKPAASAKPAAKSGATPGDKKTADKKTDGKQAGATPPAGAAPKAGTAKKPATKPARGPRLFWAAAVVVLVLGALWVTRPAWGPVVAASLSGVLPDRLLAELTPRAPAPEPTPAPTTPPPAPATSPSVAPAAPDSLARAPAAVDASPEPPVVRTVDPAAGVEGIDPETTTPGAADADRLAALERRVAALREMVVANAASDVNAQVAQRLARIESGTASAAEVARLGAEKDALLDEIKALRVRLARVEEALASVAGLPESRRNQALSLAIGQLRGAVARQAGFGRALADLRSVAGEDAEIAAALERLAPYAETGVRRFDTLRRDFGDVAAAAVLAAQTARGAGWFASTVATLKGVVTVRRVDDPRPDSLDDRLRRAERHLEAGDLGAAVAVLSPVSGPAAAALAPWLEAARARLAVTDALEALSGRSISLLARTEG